MKILHVINSLNYGGAEKLLVDTIPKYKNQGINVELFILNDIKTSFSESLEIDHNIKILKPIKTKSLYNFSHLFALRKLFNNYDIIHVHLFPSLYWLSLASFFKKYNTKLILTEHNTENKRRKLLLFKYVDRIIYKRFNKIIAISDGVNKNLRQHLGRKNKNIVTIENGIDLESIINAKQYNKTELNLKKDSNIIIQVSSFTKQKDQKTLIKAVSYLKENSELLLVGDGPLKEEHINYCKSLGVKNRVHFLGFRTDIPRLLKTADICVLSSHYEGFGLSIVEGMAANKPCIGTNVSGLAEVLKNYGVLFKPGNYKQLNSILSNLLEDKSYYDNVKKKCLNRANDYSINKMVLYYIDVYKKLIN